MVIYTIASSVFSTEAAAAVTTAATFTRYMEVLQVHFTHTHTHSFLGPFFTEQHEGHLHSLTFTQSFCLPACTLPRGPSGTLTSVNSIRMRHFLLSPELLTVPLHHHYNRGGSKKKKKKKKKKKARSEPFILPFPLFLSIFLMICHPMAWVAPSHIKLSVICLSSLPVGPK